MSVAVRAPALHQDAALTSVDAGSIAAAICFQTAGQVVTVFGKLERHFHDNADLASITKRAVAEYAAKRETQIVSVTVTKNLTLLDEDDAAAQLSIGEEHYAVTIGDLRDGRTQMDHINQVIERLKYLQAVMVMLSTTDMLGTSQALGKQMGGLNAKVQQVQKLGVQLEQFSKQVAQAQKEGKPLPADAVKPILTQLNRLNTAANPPEIRKIIQTMLTQVKELRQLPIMRQALVQNKLAQTQTAKMQLHIATKNDAPLKTENRFKVPLKLVASKDALQQPRAQVMGAEPVKITRNFTVFNPARVEQLQTRIINIASMRETARNAVHIVASGVNEHHFRLVPQQMVKAVEARQTALPVSNRSNVAPTATPRFSVIVNTAKQAPVLTALAQNNTAAVVQPVANAQQAVQQTPQQTLQTQQAIQVEPHQNIQAEYVQTTTVQTDHVVATHVETVVQSVQSPQVVQRGAEPPISVIQQAPVEQVNNQAIEAKTSNSAPVNSVSEAQPREEAQRTPETVRTAPNAEIQKTVTTADNSVTRAEPQQPVQRNKTQPQGTPEKNKPSTDETARVRIADPITKPQQPDKPEGDDKKTAKQTATIVQEFKDCGCGHCADKAKALSGTRNAPTSTPHTTGFAAPQETDKAKPKTNAGTEFRPACEGICLCGDKAKQNLAPKDAPSGEREFGRRTRRAAVPQANAA